MDAPLDSGDLGINDNDEIALAVLSDIKADGFDSPAVDALLHITTGKDGQAEVLADVLVYLAKQGHPDWAAEICRWVCHVLSLVQGRPSFACMCLWVRANDLRVCSWSL
jgi:hypothetical protein